MGSVDKLLEAQHKLFLLLNYRGNVNVKTMSARSDVLEALGDWLLN